MALFQHSKIFSTCHANWRKFTVLLFLAKNKSKHSDNHSHTVVGMGNVSWLEKELLLTGLRGNIFGWGNKRQQFYVLSNLALICNVCFFSNTRCLCGKNLNLWWFCLFYFLFFFHSACSFDSGWGCANLVVCKSNTSFRVQHTSRDTWIWDVSVFRHIGCDPIICIFALVALHRTGADAHKDNRATCLVWLAPPHISQNELLWIESSKGQFI